MHKLQCIPQFLAEALRGNQPTPRRYSAPACSHPWAPCSAAAPSHVQSFAETDTHTLSNITSLHDALLYLLKVDIDTVVDDHKHGAERINRMRVDCPGATLLQHEKYCVHLPCMSTVCCMCVYHGRDLRRRWCDRPSDVLADRAVNTLPDIVLFHFNILCQNCLDLPKSGPPPASYLSVRTFRCRSFVALEAESEAAE